ncbi:hypothetical protein H6G33_01550 [Calothrix sp. FACHB-1219]|uniref:hypothetical protein n=1 Tax=unclassified Calothrix TaxID=2619626 RepID=UPI00168929CB|nr:MULTISPECIES: hypothetical protein [unclassified Calothrix]MBD2201288.1 hypothetical protein [Calothrix sp. FACHB-168]MBD2215722.1 hypothetical protein [Calothrix sp. FACHB-1219]
MLGFAKPQPNLRIDVILLLVHLTATPEELAQAFLEWASNRDRNSALLSDYAVSWESMYDNEE